MKLLERFRRRRAKRRAKRAAEQEAELRLYAAMHKDGFAPEWLLIPEWALYHCQMRLREDPNDDLAQHTIDVLTYFTCGRLRNQ